MDISRRESLSLIGASFGLAFSGSAFTETQTMAQEALLSESQLPQSIGRELATLIPFPNKGVTVSLETIELVDTYKTKLQVDNEPRLIEDSSEDMTLISAFLMAYKGIPGGLPVKNTAGKIEVIPSWAEKSTILQFTVRVNADQHDPKDLNRGPVSYSTNNGTWTFGAKGISLEEIGIDSDTVIAGMYFHFTNSEIQLPYKLGPVRPPKNWHFPRGEDPSQPLPLGIAAHPLNAAEDIVYLTSSPKDLIKYEFAKVDNGKLSIKFSASQFTQQLADTLTAQGKPHFGVHQLPVSLDTVWKEILGITKDSGKEPFVDTFHVGVALRKP